jgi:hypothetical protein
MKYIPLLIVALWLSATLSCSSSRSSGGGGSTASASTVTADVAVQEDDPTEFKQAGESVSVVGTNLAAPSVYSVVLRLLMPEGEQSTSQTFNSISDIKLVMPVSFYAIVDIVTPNGIEFSAVVLRPNQDSKVNLRFDSTSTVASKLIEIIYQKALQGDSDAGFVLRNRLLAPANLYSMAASVLLVGEEQTRRKNIDSTVKATFFEPVDLVALASSLVTSLRADLTSTKVDIANFGKQEADASFKYFYQKELQTPTAMAAFATPQSTITESSYRAAFVNPLVAAAYSDLSVAFRNQPADAAIDDLLTKAQSLFIRTFGECLSTSACPVYPPTPAVKFAGGGKVDVPKFSVVSTDNSGAKQVVISSATEGASVYYTTDGTTPSQESTQFKSVASILPGQVIKAIAMRDGYELSDLAEGAMVARSDLDHELVTKKSIKTPSLLTVGDLLVLIVMYKYDQTVHPNGVTLTPPSGFSLQETSADLTGPMVEDGNDSMNRFQRVSIFTKKAVGDEPKILEISYPQDADPDQITAVILAVPSSQSTIKDFRQGTPSAMQLPALFAPQDAPVNLGAGERVVYVATSLFLAEAIDDRENVMVFDNLNSKDASNTTARILGRNQHWRNKLAVVIDTASDPKLKSFYPTRGFDGENYSNSNLGMRFVIPK